MSTFTCGNCRYMHEGERDALAAGKRTYQCYVKPPQAAIVPAQGGVTVISVRPAVSSDTPACAEHKVKVKKGGESIGSS